MQEMKSIKMEANLESNSKWDFHFPPIVRSGDILNKFFSIFLSEDFEQELPKFLNYLKDNSKERDVISNGPEGYSCKYILAKDFWGPKELFLYLENHENTDFTLSHVNKDSVDFRTLQEFIKDHERFSLFETGPSYIAYSLFSPNLFWPMVGDLIIVFKQSNSNENDITLFVNLIYPLNLLRGV